MVGDEVALHVARAVIAASGIKAQPLGLLPLSDLVDYFFGSMQGVYAAYLLSTGVIFGLVMGGAQPVALPFAWRERLLWLIVSSLGGLLALATDVFGGSLIFRAAPWLVFDWVPKPFGLLPIEVISHGGGTFLFGLLTGFAMFQMTRLRHRRQVERLVGQFD